MVLNFAVSHLLSGNCYVAGNDGWQNKEVKRGGNQHSYKQKVQNSLATVRLDIIT